MPAAMQVCITAFTVCLGVMTVVGALLAMNLTSGLDTPDTQGASAATFYTVTSITSAGCLAAFVVFMWWLLRSKVIVIN